MSNFTTLPIPYVPIGTQAAAVRSAIDAAQLSGDNSFGGLQNLAIRGPFLSDAEADANGVPVDNLYYQPNGTVRAASHLSLDLQFATDKTLTARVGPTPTFTRASGATYVGSDGLIQSAAVDEPRFDHDPVTLACKGLLVEEGRTNLATYSGALVVNTGWASAETTSTTSGTGPDGNTSYQVSETSETSVHTIANSGGITASPTTLVTSGTVYTGSIFLKKVTGSIDWVQLTLGSAGFGTAQYANFNIGNGTVGNSAGLASGTSPRIENYGNGWYRCSISVASTSTATTLNLITVFVNNTNGTTRAPSYAGSTSNQVLASLCQFEAGSFPTSYIPTTTGTLARSADVCSITGSDFSGFYNQPEGTLFAAYSFVSGYTNVGRSVIVAQASSNSFNELVRIGSATAATSPSFDTSVGGLQTRATALNNFNFSGINKTSGAYIVGNNAISHNGNAVVTSSPAAITSSCNRLDIGKFHPGAANLPHNGHIASIRYYKKRLPNAKLQALTV
jgi:hypothetical protein